MGIVMLMGYSNHNSWTESHQKGGFIIVKCPFRAYYDYLVRLKKNEKEDGYRLDSCIESWHQWDITKD